MLKPTILVEISNKVYIPAPSSIIPVTSIGILAALLAELQLKILY